MIYCSIYKQPKFDFFFLTKPSIFYLNNLKTPLHWLNNTIDIRQNIKKWHKNSKSIIMVGLIYARKPNKLAYNKYYMRISEYAALRDYHKVIKTKLQNLIKLIKNKIKIVSFKQNIKKLEYKIFVDSSPVYEKGYFLTNLHTYLGKNGLLLSNFGSKFVIGGISLNVNFNILQKLFKKQNTFLYNNTTKKAINNNNYSKKTAYLCNKCNICIKKCPTGALSQGGFKINIPLCISYLTVESKGPIPEFLQKRMKNWLFGCDECQNTCPYNKNYQLELSQQELNIRFGKVIPQIIYFRKARQFSYRGFYKYFAGTPVIRMGYLKFKNRVNTYIKQNIY